MAEVSLVRNSLGFVEVEPKPTTEELQAHYSGKQYFANPDSKNQYSYKYNAEELRHKQIPAAEAIHFAPAARNILEIGVGEGFFLEALRRRGGFNIKGVDFTDDGILEHNPALREFVEVGDVFEYLKTMADGSERFDLIACNNVIEHVVDPLEALRQIRDLLSEDGVCRIVVPNDGSWLQQEIVRRGFAKDLFWIDPPEHLSYFTNDALRATLQHLGFEVLDILADFPVDLFLLNSDSNYMEDRSRGRNCHFARTAFETALFERGVQDVVEFRKACAKIGIGRNLIAYARRKK